MEDLDLPEIKRKKVHEKKVEDKKEFKDLFQSDSDSDDDDDGLKIKGKLTLACSSFTRVQLTHEFYLDQSALTSWPLGGCVLLHAGRLQLKR